MTTNKSKESITVNCLWKWSANIWACVYGLNIHSSGTTLGIQLNMQICARDLLHFPSEAEACQNRGFVHVKKLESLTTDMALLVHLRFTVCIHGSNFPFALDGGQTAKEHFVKNPQQLTTVTQVLLRVQLEGLTF